MRPHLNPAKGSQDFYYYGTVNLKCASALGSGSVRNTAQFSIYDLFLYFENIISIVSLLEWETDLIVFLSCWSCEVSPTWVLLGLWFLLMHHHHQSKLVTTESQGLISAAKSLLLGFMHEKERIQWISSRHFICIKQDVCSMWHAWAAANAGISHHYLWND